MHSTLSATIALLALLSLRLVAGPLDEATVSRVVNEVTVAGPRGTPRQVAAQDVVRAGDGLRAGPRARAELHFSDGTLARLGAETVLGFRRGARELTLDQGTLLLQVPALRGGARVRTGSLTAVCGGATILIEHLPSKSLKIVLLEGDLRVSTGGFLGDSIVIPPGRMLITGPDVKRIPDPVDVDLDTLIRTSALIDPATFAAGAAPLASLPRIQREVARQAGSFHRKRLIPTNLAIVGSGTSVVIPGQPAGASSPEPVTEGNSMIVGGKSEAGARKSAEIPTDRRAALAVERESSLPEP